MPAQRVRPIPLLLVVPSLHGARICSVLGKWWLHDVLWPDTRLSDLSLDVANLALSSFGLSMLARSGFPLSTSRYLHPLLLVDAP